jgi:hypothetical protein
MPIFAFRKERFDPHAAFTVRLLVGFGVMVGMDTVKIAFIDTATEAASLGAGGTLGFERTVSAIFGPCPIPSGALGGLSLAKVQLLSGRTAILIALAVILEVLLTKERRTLGQVSDGDIGMDVLALHRHDVVAAAILGISRHLMRS